MSAGWHPDHDDPTQERYWDGKSWTNRLRPVSLPQRYRGRGGQDLLAADLHGLGLLKHLAQGGRPATISGTFRMVPDEEAYCSVEGELLTLAEGQYLPAGHTTVGLGSSFLMLGMTLGASALVNARRDGKARAAASLQWRSLTAGVVHITTHRVAAQGHGGWIDIWLAHVNQVVFDADGVVLLVSGSQPLKIGLGNTLYAFVLLHWLVMGRVPEMHPEIITAIRSAAFVLEGQDVPAARFKSLPS